MHHRYILPMGLLAVVLASCADTPTAAPDRTASSQRGTESSLRVVAHSGFAATVAQTAPYEDLGDPVTNALGYLESQRELYGLHDPASQLVPHRVFSDEDGDHVFFRRRYGDLVAFSGSFGVHMDPVEQVVTLTHGHLPAGDLPLRERGLLTKDEALEAALSGEYGTRLELLGSPELGVWPHRDERTGERAPREAYRMAMGGTDADGVAMIWMVMIDAADGSVLVAQPQIEHAKDIRVRDGGDAWTSGCWSFIPNWFNEAGMLPAYNTTADHNGDGATAWQTSHSTYDYWWNTFGQDSFDDAGEQQEVITHVDFPLGPNASASGFCGEMKFDDGMVTADIHGHEFSHLVDYENADLEYSFQSGALDESFADLFGVWAAGSNWQVGVGSVLANGTSACPGFRNLSNPPGCNHPDHMTAGFGTPGNPGFLITLADNGGVHTNSGIPNKVGFLLTAGGTHNSIPIAGMGQSKTEDFYHRLLTSYVTEHTDFEDLATIMLWKAVVWSINNQNGFTSQDVCDIRNAWASVGVLPDQADVDCNGISDTETEDADGDGIPDGIDNCVGVYNPTQWDQDGDGLGFMCDDDVDGDGIDNGPDNCMYVPNPNQEDSNNDGWGDACTDSDGDGTLDMFDNCPNDPNADQADQDGDGIGDVCDPDPDGDGLVGYADNCPEIYNPDQEDSDGDGAGDVCDNCELYNPDQADCNSNGIGDACEPNGEYLKILCFDWYEAEFHAFIPPHVLVSMPHILDDRDWLGDDYTLSFTVATEFPIGVHLVDQQGRVLAKGTASREPATLTWQPEGAYHNRLEDGELAPWTTELFLEFDPALHDEDLSVDIQMLGDTVER